MTMNVHMLAALDDLFQRWQDRLAALTDEQLTMPLSPSELSIKDNLAHVWAWQQRSVAKVVAALDGHDPQYPVWPVVEGDPDEDDKTDVANAWIFQNYHAMPWREVFEGWRANFRRFLDLAAEVSERDLLDSGKYPWMDGHPLAATLLGTYDHHQEHYDVVDRWLREHGSISPGA